MASREVYLKNCEKVYDIYGIPKRDRGGRYTMHHIVLKSDYKYGLVTDDGKRDNPENLYPLLAGTHDNLHRKLEYMGEDWNGGVRVRKKH